MKSTSQKLKVGDFVINYIDKGVYKYGTVLETDIMGGYARVCWIKTDIWPVSRNDFFEDLTREISLHKIDSPNDLDRFPL